MVEDLDNLKFLNLLYMKKLRGKDDSIACLNEEENGSMMDAANL